MVLKTLSADTIKQTWATDAVIDRFDLTKEMARVYTMHAKYLDQWDIERRTRDKIVHEQKQLDHAKFYHYLFGPTPETKDWPYSASGKILRADIPKWMDADPDLQAMDERVKDAEYKVHMLDKIIESIRFRTNAIKAMMEHEKFKAGQ